MNIHDLNKSFRTYFPFDVPIDGLGMILNKKRDAVIDIIKLDLLLSKYDNEYDNVKCTYKGKPEYSMARYIEEKYGKEAFKLIKNNMK